MVLNDRYSRRRVAIMAIILLVSLRPSRTFGQRPIVQAAANNNKKAAVEWFGLGGVAAAEAVQTDEYIQEELIVIDDHVAPVHGLESVDLAFDGIEMTLEGKKGQKRKLLDGSIRGRARPGRMLAIMGPSGAGKSTLLHALAGRIRDQKKLSLQGRRFLNGEPISGDSVLPIAFVEQEVTFFPHMTVRETLQFRVELKLGNKLKSQRARDARVEELLDLVGLQKAADTIVGNAKVRGISGGERKRLSIAVEMITSPSCIFLDEPTSGLDSTAATSLVRLLRKLADQGKTVVAVIHQPSQHVFNQFDDLLLVSEGRQLYFGEVSNVRSYMEAHGCHAPREMGTSEHVLDCITKLPVNGESTVEDSQRRLDRLADLATAKPLNLGLKSRGGGGTPTKHFVPVAQHAPNANMLRQFQLLLRRSFREIKRAKATLIIKAVQQVTLGLVYGGIYSLGNDQASIQDRFGLLSLIAIGASNMACAQAVRAFPKEKAIVSGEIAANMYRTLPYFIGKALSELPLVGLLNGLFGVIVYRLTGLSQQPGKFARFLMVMGGHGLLSEAMGLLIGAVSPSSDVALALFPAVIVLNVIFDGKNISPENTPRLLSWIPKVGLIRWGFEGLAVNEFDGLEFVASGPRRGPVARTGAEALARFGLGSNTVWDVIKAQLVITGACWALSWLGLTLSKQKFLEMRVPSDEEEQAQSKYGYALQ